MGKFFLIDRIRDRNRIGNTTYLQFRYQLNTLKLSVTLFDVIFV